MTVDLRPHILSLADVTHRRMFGADCFLARGRMFAFVMTDGLVLKLPEEKYREALALPGVGPFIMTGGVPFGKWAQFPSTPAEPLIPWMQLAHESVLAQPAARRRKRSAKP